MQHSCNNRENFRYLQQYCKMNFKPYFSQQMRNNLLLILAFLSLPIVAWTQVNITWKQLAEVDFEMRYFKAYDLNIMAPIFGKSPKAFEGKEIIISGYVLPLDINDFVLSQNPYASCFFCGGAGPETIVELQLKPEAARHFRMDQWMTFKGILRLNHSDPYHFIYILERAELINNKR